MDATPNQPNVEAMGVEAVEPLLGSDPWMRFDMWANRAWEASEKAIDTALEIGGSDRPDDSVDDRVVAMFHAAGIAKEFARMVNPLDAPLDGPGGGAADRNEVQGMIISLLADEE